MKRKILLLLLVSALLTSTIVNAGGWSFTNCSNWAKDELEEAMVNQISTKEYDDYSRDITRKEFAELVMNLYYQTMGTLPEPASYSTFTDTNDEKILMAYKLGIIYGKSTGANAKFAPNDAVTRQEMAIMMKRAIDSMGINYKKADGVLTISDKGKVSSWAKDGVDFVFENGFMQGYNGKFSPLNTTPIEQGVIIVNRVYKEYGNFEPNDYTQGYTTKVTSKGLSVTYNNNGRSEIVVSLEEFNPEKGGGSRSFSNIHDVRTIYSDLSKIYFLDSLNRLWYYDFYDGTCFQFAYKGALNVKEYKVVDSGQYYGYVAVNDSSYTGTETNLYVFDRYGEYLGELEMMTDLNYQIGEIYAQIEAEKYKFAIKVTDAINFPGDIEIGEDYIYFFSNANHYTYVDNGVGYLRMYPYSYDSNDYTGPIGMAGTDRNTQFAFNGYGGIYQVDMTFHNESGNAGIVFNLVNASDGNDNYRGYYVGVSPENDTVMFGKSTWNWDSIKETSLGFDVERYDKVTLKVIKAGTDIEVYVNGKKYIDVKDSYFSDDGGFGIRTWKSDVSYSNYSVKPLPY